MSNTTLPAIPTVPADVAPELAAFLSAVKEILDVRTGAAGDPMDRGVTFNDLVDVQLATASPGATYSGASVPADIIVPAYVEPVYSLTPPAAPGGLTATASLNTIILTWTAVDDDNYDHTEIYRADSDNSGAATLIGVSDKSATVYADAVGATNVTRYYWLKGVSVAGVKSISFSASANAKTGLIGGQDLSNLIVDASKLANSAVTSSKIANAAIGAAAIQNAAIQNAAIQDGAITNAKIGSLDAGKINTGYLSAGRLAADSITGDKLSVTNLDSKLATISNAYVNTLHVAGNAITVPVSAMLSDSLSLTTTPTTIISASIEVPWTAPNMAISVNAAIPYQTQSTDPDGVFLECAVYCDGIRLDSTSFISPFFLTGGVAVAAGISGSLAYPVIVHSALSASYKHTPGAGTHTYSIRAWLSDATGVVVVHRVALLLLGVKR